ncbi:type II 3-dehydroquinate dehydratase [Candidatus Poribacteria bacterium]|nr:MAG: type II 3-dehydroquinate dehydratase [Candidatus Poribacteria bacterium]
MNILVLHGPNLHLLGKRQPEIYGHETLADINTMLDQHAAASSHPIVLKMFQSNHEGELVSIIGDHIDWADGILINPAAYTHTSVGIRDALSTVALPVIEIHLSNIYAREEFRHHSYISAIAAGVIGGFGTHSYKLALEAMIHILQLKMEPLAETS